MIACEFSGVVRDAFAKKGHDAWSCDLLPSEKPGKHYQGSVHNIIGKGWDMMIAHPPCTYLAVSGNRWMRNNPKRVHERKMAVSFFLFLALYYSIEKICIENPVGIMSSCYRKPDQYIQPWQFGHKRTKKTGLWLKNLPKLKSTKIVDPEYVIYKSKKNKSGYSKYDKYWGPMGSSVNRNKLRLVTFQGIADAMADQWSEVA